MILKHLCSFCLFFLTIFSCAKKEISDNPILQPLVITKKYEKPDLTLKVTEAKDFVNKNALNEDFCILIDLGIHSGRKRFFVWDFKKNKVIHEFLVGHGCGDNQWSADQSKEDPTFSNEIDSHRSSLGKYKLGKRGFSNWGVNINYIMHGLEETNNNAVKRIIVFHSWEVVSDEEVYPAGTPEGWGCPTISNKSFLTIDPMLKNSKRPILMWIFSSKTDE